MKDEGIVVELFVGDAGKR